MPSVTRQTTKQQDSSCCLVCSESCVPHLPAFDSVFEGLLAGVKIHSELHRLVQWLLRHLRLLLDEPGLDATAKAGHAPFLTMGLVKQDAVGQLQSRMLGCLAGFAVVDHSMLGCRSAV